MGKDKSGGNTQAGNSGEMRQIDGDRFDIAACLEGAGEEGGLQPAGSVSKEKGGAVSKAKEDEKGSQVNLTWLILEDHKLDHKMKRRLGVYLPIAAGVQIALMNIAFAAYMVLSYVLNDGPSTSIVIAYITTSMAEVLGLALVVTRYLFPDNGVSWNAEKKGAV